MPPDDGHETKGWPPPGDEAERLRRLLRKSAEEQELARQLKSRDKTES